MAPKITDPCGYWLPIKEEPCAKPKGHKNVHASASALESSRRWGKDNRGKRSQTINEWRRANRDKVYAASRRWKQANPDKIREYKRTYEREINGRIPRGQMRDPNFPVTIYGLFDSHDRLLYIGQTVQNLNERLNEHRCESAPWRDEISYIHPIMWTTWVEADSTEQFLLYLSKGLHNVRTYDPNTGFSDAELRELPARLKKMVS